MSAPPGSRARIGILGRSYGYVTSSKVGSASLLPYSQITAAAYKVRYAAASLSANAVIKATSKDGRSLLTTRATVTATAAKSASATVSGNGVITAKATSKNGRATVSGNAAFTATAVRIVPVVKPADSSPSGYAQITVTPPARTVLTTAGILGRGVFIATALGANGRAGLSSNASINAIANKNGGKSGNAIISGYAVVTAPAINKNGRATLLGQSIITATAARAKSANISGNATITATVSSKNGRATVSGNGVVTATALSSNPVKTASATLSGKGQVSPTATSKNGRTTLSGNAVIIATGQNKSARTTISGNAVVTPIATKLNIVFATAGLSGNANITATASNKTVKVSISGNAVITGVVQRGRIYAVTGSLLGRAIITGTAIPPSRACECPPWLHDDNKTCNWVDPVICIEQAESELPFTLPSFRMQALFKATYRGYVLRSTACTPYAYTSLNNGFYAHQQTVVSSWINTYTSTTSWRFSATINNDYTQLPKVLRDLPYTLPLFRLHNPTTTVVNCEYTVDGLQVTAYSQEQTNQTVYNISGALAGTYVRKGCE